MSRASKIFLASSFLVSGVTVWGVHYIQKRESDTMYQGVIKDEARIAAKAAASAAAAVLKPITPSALTSTPSKDVTSTAHSSGTPLNTPSSPVQQPAPVIDEECTTCVISPPPQLLESQSKEQRAKERELRMKEYNEQKSLDSRLRNEQGVSEQPTGTRLV
ncbi:hypothetical protein I203_107944 [Kwoniella mangroviensis CBS 8507]|uniref:hypothetical protein n=1 Tax=Kwoniella mangroviensis CBS 8507 TaxID=1296122 RepID=UPI00080D4666|nr:uncharacterized protein I203_04839 [Kwoniella mangroviensis CBS 8507]OCF65819.1 hypothetical protein I203_04839 [Kwoniella mangroviensis CBS 8507]